MTGKTTTFTFPPYKVTRDWMYAPETYLVDSWEPFVEEIYLPEAMTKQGKLFLTVKENSETDLGAGSKFISRLYTLIKRCKPLTTNSDKHVVLDLRQRDPENLAHAITNHLPLALYIKSYLQCDDDVSVLLLFPKSLPNYIQQLFIEIGFDVLLTNAVVRGSICEYSLEPWISIRGIRNSILGDNLSNSNFSRKLQQINQNNLPTKLFISRRDTRCLINEEEVEQFLLEYGYKKIYLEDYDINEQIAIVSLADSIVAIHGAALSVLIFRALFSDIPPIKVIEIFSPGHMTNVYRVITHQLNGEWVGVRGKLWPSIIVQAYKFPKKKHKYAYVNFEICLKSLQKALERFNS